MPRAATTHAATLEMLAGLGMVDEVIERGYVEPLFRIWDRQSKQHRRRIRLRHAQGRDALPVRRAMRAAQARRHGGRAAEEISQRQGRVLGPRDGARASPRDGVEIEVENADGTRKIAGSYLIGTDGGRSTVRKALGIEFEGYTHPERFMILTTTDNLGASYPGCTRNYISDPDAWFSLFKVSGDERGPLWRVLSSTRPEQTDDELMSPEATEQRLQRFLPKDGRLRHRPPQSLQRAPAGRGELPQGPRVPRGRCGARQQSARRARV